MMPRITKGAPYCISAVWPAPPGVQVRHTVRWGGVSTSPYLTWNLGGHVSDAPTTVARNQQILLERFVVKPPIQWLNQTHSTRVIEYGQAGVLPDADGVLLSQPGQSAAVLTADCLPVVLAREDGGAAVVVHAGWRGLANGILTQAIHRLSTAERSERDAGDIKLTAWLGPCVLPRHFEVGPEVRDTFLARVPGAASAFLPLPEGRWQGMLSRLAYLALRAKGVRAIHGFGITQTMPSLGALDPFFSYRRATQAGSVTGRVATVLSLS